MNVVSFGEIMLRLSPLDYRQRINSTGAFDVNFAGAESNVSTLLSLLGHQVDFVTALPDNAVGDACVSSLKGYGIGTRHVARVGSRIGTYFVELGSSIRPSRVVYDRKHSSISEVGAGLFDWNEIFDRCRLFHVSGITPAISSRCADELMNALVHAKERGVKVSFDLNYRRTLWEPADARKVFDKILDHVDLLFGNAGVMRDLYGFEEPDSRTDEAIVKTKVMFGINEVAFTVRKHHSASRNELSGVVIHDDILYRSISYDVEVADRFGTGDAFAGGLLHGMLMGWSYQRSVAFAAACFAYKHTVSGDQLISHEKEIESIVDGHTTGHVIR